MRNAVDPVAVALLVRRHLAYQRHAWAAVVTALVEPAVYFAAALVGIGYVLDGGFSAHYIRYAGPALLAVTVMNGAVAECTNNVFFRWRQGRLYDSVLCTPLTAHDIAAGDLVYGALRGWASGIVFLGLLVPFLHLGVGNTSLLVLVTIPVALLFAALGLLITTVIRSWRQLQLVQLGFFLMFLSANTFVNLGTGGRVLGWAAQALPLTHANELVRATTDANAGVLLREALVVSVAAVALIVWATRRFSRALTA